MLLLIRHLAFGFIAAMACVPAAQALQVTGAGPIVDADDGPKPGRIAVSFSPDGDGANDVAFATVRGTPGTRVRMIARAWGTSGSVRTVGTGTVVVIPASGEARVEWRGRSGRRPLADGPYDVAVCATSGGCAGTRIAAHLRNLAALIDSDGGFAPGDAVPLVIRSDRERLTVGIGPDGVNGRMPLMAQTEVASGRVSYRIPDDLEAGLYRLVVKGASGVWRALPLLVRTTDLERPPKRATLVVMPYLTWSVYNRYDADRDGRPDTHYVIAPQRMTPLVAPYERPGTAAPGNAGREQDFKHMRGFMRAYAEYGGPDAFPAAFVTDVEFGRMAQVAIDRYDMVLFPGHTEYVTTGIFDRVRAYQRSGGDFVYLSANGFFASIAVTGNAVRLLARPQRSPTRNDGMITGVQYSGCCWVRGSPGPMRISATAFRRLSWVFDGTGLRPGDILLWAGGEIDGFGPQSPRGMNVLADIEWKATEAYQPAQTVLYSTPGGGRVFAAGTMAFVQGMGERFAVRRLFENVWTRFVGSPPPVPKPYVDPVVADGR